MAANNGLKYRAFVSYSHGDEGWARWLQRALERYRVPRKLRAAHPHLPKRLYPVFRDREELASSADLSDSIQQHMAQSAALIVVCSPAAARSRWVNEEIRHYRAIGRGDRIFCLLVDGSPEREAPDCAFPPALLTADDGTPLPEPLAADVRDGGDGRRGALLKIAAGMLGVGIDDLRQRDAQRQVRTWTAIAVGSMAIAVLTIGLAIVAYLAREESELRRGQAEGLISFMLGDLRGKLEPVGRLDVLDAVGDQAMDYFAALGDRGTEDEVMARAMALRQIGEVRFAQGQLEPALEAFTESRDIARALHQAHPGNDDFLFELGQAEFWVGYVALERNDLPGAAAGFGAYHEVSRQLAERDPVNADFRMELLFAASNLGTVALERGRADEAIAHFTESVEINRELLDDAADDDTLRYELANGLSWLGSAHLAAGDLRGSEQVFGETVETLSPLHASGAHPRYSNEYADSLSLFSEVKLHLGQVEAARVLLDEAIDVFNELSARDSENARWLEALHRTLERRGRVAWVEQRQDDFLAIMKQATAGLTTLHEGDPSDVSRLQRLARAEAGLAVALGIADQHQAATDMARRAVDGARRGLVQGSGTTTQRIEAADTALLAGIAMEAVGSGDAAKAAWSFGLQAIEDTGTHPVLLALKAALLANIGKAGEASTIADRLSDAGFVDPRYLPAN